MIKPPLFGPAARVLQVARELAAGADRFAILLEGDPGVGKTSLADQLAAEIAGSPHAVELVNGQSLSVDVVRAWRQSAAYGNLFSAWTIKRIDELDQASIAGMAELLTYLDYLPAGKAIIATTNEYAKLKSLCKGRLETRFVRFTVDAPSIEETLNFLRREFKLDRQTAAAIANGAVPEGSLALAGCNVRGAMNDARGFVAARKVQTLFGKLGEGEENPGKPRPNPGETPRNSGRPQPRRAA